MRCRIMQSHVNICGDSDIYGAEIQVYSIHKMPYLNY